MTTKERNEAFAKLTAEQKRVAIASDVLSYLDAKRIVALPGTYIRIPVVGDVSDEEQVCSVIAAAPDCKVCAIGATFMAAVERANALKIKDVDATRWTSELQISYEGMTEYLGKFFDDEQLLLIEAAFEGYDPHGEIDYEFLDDVTKMFVWTENDDDDGSTCSTSPDDRMRAIMANIVANNGTFCP